MSIVSKHGQYQFFLLVWILAIAGATAAIVTGYAEPYLTLTDLPVESVPQLVGVAIGLVIVGALVYTQFEKRIWIRAGKRMGLTPTERSLAGKPTLERTLDGHTVNSHYTTALRNCPELRTLLDCVVGSQISGCRRFDV